MSMSGSLLGRVGGVGVVEVAKDINVSFMKSISSSMLHTDGDHDDPHANSADSEFLSQEQISGTSPTERREELISSHFVTVHRQPRSHRAFHTHTNTKFNGRNIAIALLPVLQDDVAGLKREFFEVNPESGELTVAELVKLLEGRLEKLTTPRPPLFANPSATFTAIKEMFAVIDLGEREVISWDEFFSYCIDASIMGPTGFDASSIVRKWEPKLFALTRNKEPLERVKYNRHLQKVMCITREGTLRMMSPLNYTFSKALWPVRGKVIASEYIPKFDRVAVSSSDMSVRLFDNMGRFEEINTMHSMMSLSWSQRWDRLYSGSRTGSVHVWSLTGGGSEGLIVKPTEEFQPHSAPVTDMLINPLDGCVVSCSMDQTIVIQDPIHGKELQRYRGHEAGVIRIDYTPDYNLLLSGAMETNVFVWPFGASKNARPFTLIDPEKPHRFQICSVVVVPHTPQFITLDVKGMMKFWDVRKFTCTQTSYCAHTELEKKQFWGDGCAISNHTFMACSTKKTYLFEVDSSSVGKDKRCEDVPVAHACSSGLSLVTVGETTVKTWDIGTGELMTDYKHICSELITSACVDDQGKMIFLGTPSGVVQIHNLTNGANVSKFMIDMGKEVCSICYARTLDGPLLICALVNSRAVVVSIKDLTSPRVMPLNQCIDDLRFLTYSHTNDMLAAISPTLHLYAWSSTGFTFASGMKFINKIFIPSCQTSEPTEREVVSLEAIESDALVVVGISNGEVCIVRVPSFHIVCAFAVVNLYRQIVTSISKAVAFRFEGKLRCFTADEDGVVSVIDISHSLHPDQRHHSYQAPKLIKQSRVHNESIVQVCSVPYAGSLVTFAMDLQGIILNETLECMGLFDRFGTSTAQNKMQSRAQLISQHAHQVASSLSSMRSSAKGLSNPLLLLAKTQRLRANSLLKSSKSRTLSVKGSSLVGLDQLDDEGNASFSLDHDDLFTTQQTTIMESHANFVPMRGVSGVPGTSRLTCKYIDKKCNVTIIPATSPDRVVSPHGGRKKDDDVGTKVDVLLGTVQYKANQKGDTSGGKSPTAELAGALQLALPNQIHNKRGSTSLFLDTVSTVGDSDSNSRSLSMNVKSDSMMLEDNPGALMVLPSPGRLAVKRGEVSLRQSKLDEEMQALKKDHVNPFSRLSPEVTEILEVTNEISRKRMSDIFHQLHRESNIRNQLQHTRISPPPSMLLHLTSVEKEFMLPSIRPNTRAEGQLQPVQYSLVGAKDRNNSSSR
eukprot:PhF_6_TR42684/c0_g1_i1/m.64381